MAIVEIHLHDRMTDLARRAIKDLADRRHSAAPKIRNDRQVITCGRVTFPLVVDALQKSGDKIRLAVGIDSHGSQKSLELPERKTKPINLPDELQARIDRKPIVQPIRVSVGSSKDGQNARRNKKADEVFLARLNQLPTERAVALYEAIKHVTEGINTLSDGDNNINPLDLVTFKKDDQRDGRKVRATLSRIDEVFSPLAKAIWHNVHTAERNGDASHLKGDLDNTVIAFMEDKSRLRALRSSGSPSRSIGR